MFPWIGMMTLCFPWLIAQWIKALQWAMCAVMVKYVQQKYIPTVDKFGTHTVMIPQTPGLPKIWTDFAKFFPNIEVKDTGERFVASKKAVNEGYVLQLERGKFDAVLHIKDTKTGERMEVSANLDMRLHMMARMNYT